MKIFVKETLDEWDHPTINLPNASNAITENDYDEDPHGIIPTGWVFPRQYKVICFVGGWKDVLSLMVGVKYKNCTGRYSTTRDYIHVLKDYLTHVDYMEVLLAKDRYLDKKIQECKKKGLIPKDF